LCPINVINNNNNNNNILEVIMEMIFPANLLTGAKQPKSANHPKVNTFLWASCIPNRQPRTTKTPTKQLLTYVQTEANETEAWFSAVFYVDRP